jgi:hypothetical protein
MIAAAPRFSLYATRSTTVYRSRLEAALPQLK